MATTTTTTTSSMSTSNSNAPQLQHAPLGGSILKKSSLQFNPVLNGVGLSNPSSLNLKSCLYDSGKYSTLPSIGGTSSLNRLMASRNALKSMHASFVLDMEKNRRQLLPQQQLSPKKAQPVAEVDYGYGYGYGADEPGDQRQSEPANKRRRYQRRNSKTPQMLMAMQSNLLNLDFLKELDAKTEAEEEKAEQAATAESSNKKEEKKSEGFADDGFGDSWDGGLMIAEELVMHLQKRRRSQT